MYQLAFLDISQFVQEPLRTGVQRVLVKIIENMPRGCIMPFRVVDEKHVAILDPAIFDICVRYFYGQTPSTRAQVAAAQGLTHASSEEERLIKLIGNHPLAVLQAERFFDRAATIINLESFSQPERSRFYISCPPSARHKVFHFIHDFLLFEAPHVFPQLNWRYASDYVLLFEAYRNAGGYLVSTAEMAGKCAHYFSRPAADTHIVRFGGDTFTGEGGAAGGQHAGRRHVVVLGTIEPRKYPLTVVQALDEIARRHPDVDCTMAGGWGWVEAATRARIEEIFASGTVRHRTGLGDDELASLMSSADVGIYVSSTEGFGLPVIEFGALGIPLVTNRAVPAASLVMGESVSVLDEVTPATLIAAIERQLQTAHARVKYYPWTWADSASDVLAATPFAEIPTSAFRGIAGWQSCIQLVRLLRDKSLDWEALKKAVHDEVTSDSGLSFELFGPQAGEVTTSIRQVILESVSEVVSDNQHLVYWGDFIQIEPLLAELARALAAENYLDGLSRAFITFLNRPIDGRAASEAMGISGLPRVFSRIVDLIYSDEAAAALRDQIRIPLVAVIRAIREVAAAWLEPHVDLFLINEQLGLPAPSLEEVLMAENFRKSEISKLELLIYFADRRPLRGDAFDLFLEVVARLCRERGTLIGAPSIATAVEEAEPGKSKPQGVASLPRSFMRTLPAASAAFSDGWYAIEYAGSNIFRWMGSKSTIANPEPARALREVKLDVQHVYGSHEPVIQATLGGKPADINVEEKERGRGWILTLSAGADGIQTPQIGIESLVSDSPAIAEGSTDNRVLSLCVLGATLIYRD
jgi:glycosyltransferase involved in cell wall biosynthesis